MLVYLATTVVVLAVALIRAHGRPAELLDAALGFAASASGIMAAALVSATIFAMVAFASARLLAPGVLGALRLGRTRASAAGLASAVFGMAGLSLAAGAGCDLLGWQGAGTMAAIARALERPTAPRLALAVVTIAFAPAFAEETFFRGLVQTRLAARWGRWPAIAATAAGFGLIHLDPAQALVACGAGLFLGWIAERFGGIRPGIFAHAFNNAAFVVVASFGSAGASNRIVARWILGFGSAVCASSIALLRSRWALAPESAGSLRE